MTISSETSKSGPYLGNGSTKIFDYQFKIVDETHLTVIKRDTSGVESTLILNTDYTVADVGQASGGQITLDVAPAVGETITILRNVPFTQETDLENQGAYYAETVEAAFDLMVMRDQQMREELSRAVKLPADEDASGLDELIADLRRVADSADEIDMVAGSVANIATVATNITNVNALGPVASAVADVASIKDEVEAVANNLQVIDDIGDLADEIAALGAISAEIVTVYNIAGDVQTVAGIDSDVQTVAYIAADVSNVAARGGDVTTVASIGANVTDVAGIKSDVTAVAMIAGDVSTVASIGGAITTVAGASADIAAVAGITGDIADVKAISGAITTVAGIDNAVSTVANNSANINTVAANISDIQAVGPMAGDIADVVAIKSEIEALGPISADITTVAGIKSEILGVPGLVDDAEQARDEAVAAVAGMTGGITGQVLVKKSNDDFDYEWWTIPGGGDMLASVYDPTGVVDDAFNRANHYGTIDIADVDGLTAALAGKAGTEVATTSANGLMSSTDKIKLDGVEAGAQVNAVDSVAGLTGTITDAALFAALGLGNMAYEDSNDFVDKAGDEMHGGLVYRHGDAGTNVLMHSYQFGNKDYASVGVDLYSDGSLDFHAFDADTGAWIERIIRLGIDGYVTLASDPTEDKHAATKQYVDTNAVLKAGDTGLGGYTSAGHNLGNLSGQSITPDPTQTSNFKYGTNNGAFTLNAPTVSGYYTIAILITNAISVAGAMTTSGFNKVQGSFSTAASKLQILTIEVFGSTKVLTIRDAN